VTPRINLLCYADRPIYHIYTSTTMATQKHHIGWPGLDALSKISAAAPGDRPQLQKRACKYEFHAAPSTRLSGRRKKPKEAEDRYGITLQVRSFSSKTARR